MAAAPSSRPRSRSRRRPWPRTLPDGLTDSELYLQALESGAAILYNREPITASETTKEAVASLEEDGGRFEIYFFTGEGDSAACDRILYENTDGTITSSASHTDDWTANSELIPGQSITEPSITRYGFFTARDAGGETMGFRSSMTGRSTATPLNSVPSTPPTLPPSAAPPSAPTPGPVLRMPAI